MEGNWVWISETSLPFGPVELNRLAGKEIQDWMGRGDTTVRAVASLEEAANLDVTSREVSLNIVEAVVVYCAHLCTERERGTQRFEFFMARIAFVQLVENETSACRECFEQSREHRHMKEHENRARAYKHDHKH